MTGTLPSIPLQQNTDENGIPQSGCRLFVYAANTSTPVITYKDFLMSTGMEHSWPIVADALGRIPMFWVPDGYYRARLEDRYRTPLYDEAQLPALSTGEGGGGGGATSAVQWVTGDFLWQPVQGVRENWVRANARTIGNALSGASERANADCASLFAFLWNNFDNTACPVSGGRGASGPADFDANKQIGVYDMRGFAGMGLDGMGNTAAGRFGNVPVLRGGVDAPGSWLGGNSHILTVAQLAQHPHAVTVTSTLTVTDAGHTHGYGLPDFVPIAGVGTNGHCFNTYTPQTTGVGYADIRIGGGITAVANNAGSSEAHNNVPYVVTGTWYVRL